MSGLSHQLDRREAKRWLDLAARLALRGMGDVEPNPMVGCVLVKGGQAIGLGHHRVFGSAHAEREALANARERGIDPRGATAYVTLEPCRHFGKQPPCTEALIAAGVARVIYAAGDPGGESGGGADLLRAAGIACEQSGASERAIAVTGPFLRRHATGLPWVIAKWAQTLDGRIATRAGQSQWISGAAARRRVHRLRARVDAVLVGGGTVLGDDPALTARGVGRVRRVARRVVLDSGLRTPTDARLLEPGGPGVTIFTTDGADAGRRAGLERAGAQVVALPSVDGRVDVRAALAWLARERGVATVLVESGPTLLGSLVEHDLIDQALVHTAPMLLGDDRALASAGGRVAPSLSDARQYRIVRTGRVGGDSELILERVRVTAAFGARPLTPR
ncbi:MAG: bifunctional diaminohydroxyphosphoribosylaminopyrimidine deaminase/5-amino-6-(5-phosphoribosylamino)uracil reductase RibD [Planctomycetota bacterium]